MFLHIPSPRVSGICQFELHVKDNLVKQAPCWGSSSGQLERVTLRVLSGHKAFRSHPGYQESGPQVQPQVQEPPSICSPAGSLRESSFLRPSLNTPLKSGWGDPWALAPVIGHRLPCSHGNVCKQSQADPCQAKCSCPFASHREVRTTALKEEAQQTTAHEVLLPGLPALLRNLPSWQPQPIWQGAPQTGASWCHREKDLMGQEGWGQDEDLEASPRFPNPTLQASPTRR